MVSVDDTIRPGVTAESLQKLKPVFPEWGEAHTTAGNASGVGDGAAICILTTRERAEQQSMEILGKYVASTFVGWSGGVHFTLCNYLTRLQVSNHGIWAYLPLLLFLGCWI